MSRVIAFIFHLYKCFLIRSKKMSHNKVKYKQCFLLRSHQLFLLKGNKGIIPTPRSLYLSVFQVKMKSPNQHCTIITYGFSSSHFYLWLCTLREGRGKDKALKKKGRKNEKGLKKRTVFTGSLPALQTPLQSKPLGLSTSSASSGGLPPQLTQVCWPHQKS